jgi:hypothetical protein
VQFSIWQVQIYMYKYFSSGFIITRNYSCDFSCNNLLRGNFNDCFALQCLNLWNGFLIYLNPSSSRRDKTIYISISLLFLKITWDYSCDFAYRCSSQGELQRLFSFTSFKLMEWIHIWYKSQAILDLTSPYIYIYVFLFYL